MERTYEIYGARQNESYYHGLLTVTAVNEKEALNKFKTEHSNSKQKYAVLFLCVQTGESSYEGSVWALNSLDSKYVLVVKINAGTSEDLLSQLTSQDPLAYRDLVNRPKPKPLTREQQLENELFALRQQVSTLQLQLTQLQLTKVPTVMVAPVAPTRTATSRPTGKPIITPTAARTVSQIGKPQAKPKSAETKSMVQEQSLIRLKAYETQTRALDSQIQVLQAQINALQAERQKYSEDLKSAQAKILEYNTLISKLTTRAEMVVSSRNEVARLQKEQIDCRNEIARLQKEQLDLREKLAKLQKELVEYQNQISKDTATQLALRREFELQSETLETVRADKERFQMALQSEKQINQNYKRQREASSQDILVDLQKKETQIAALQVLNRQYKQDLEQQSNECKKDFDDLSALQVKFSALEEEKLAWEEEKRQYVSVIDLLKGRLSTCEANAKVASLAAASKCKEETVSQTSEAIKRLVSQQNKLQTMVQSQAQLITSARDELETVKTERDRAVSDCRANEETLRNAKVAQTKATTENKTLQQSLSIAQREKRKALDTIALRDKTLQQLLAEKDVQQQKVATSHTQDKVLVQQLGLQKQIADTQTLEVRRLHAALQAKDMQLLSAKTRLQEQQQRTDDLEKFNAEYESEQKKLIYDGLQQKQVVAKQKEKLIQLQIQLDDCQQKSV